MAKKKVNVRKDYSYEAKIRLPAFPRAKAQRQPQFLVLRGPGLNLTTINDENAKLKEFAKSENIKLKLLIVKTEEELVNAIKESNTWATGVVYNPGVLTHESGEIKKITKKILIPSVEVRDTASYQEAILKLLK